VVLTLLPGSQKEMKDWLHSPVKAPNLKSTWKMVNSMTTMKNLNKKFPSQTLKLNSESNKLRNPSFNNEEYFIFLYCQYEPKGLKMQTKCQRGDYGVLMIPSSVTACQRSESCWQGFFDNKQRILLEMGQP